MAYENSGKVHELKMSLREKLDVSGVEDVSGFDENTVILKTPLGLLTIQGEALHVDKIDLDTGNIELRGKICSLSYDDSGSSSSFWARLFG